MQTEQSFRTIISSQQGKCQDYKAEGSNSKGVVIGNASYKDTFIKFTIDYCKTVERYSKSSLDNQTKINYYNKSQL